MDKPHLRRIEIIVDLLDRKFSVFGFRFGLDPVLGLIPGLGDVFPFLVSLYIIAYAVSIRVPGRDILRMVGFSVLDFLVGEIPVIGDMADFIFKSNVINLNIVKRHLESTVYPA